MGVLLFWITSGCTQWGLLLDLWSDTFPSSALGTGKLTGDKCICKANALSQYSLSSNKIFLTQDFFIHTKFDHVLFNNVLTFILYSKILKAICLFIQLNCHQPVERMRVSRRHSYLRPGWKNRLKIMSQQWLGVTKQSKWHFYFLQNNKTRSNLLITE